MAEVRVLRFSVPMSWTDRLCLFLRIYRVPADEFVRQRQEAIEDINASAQRSNDVSSVQWSGITWGYSIRNGPRVWIGESTVTIYPRDTKE